MTLTHLPTKASIVSNQTFGFVSGAEGFIFLAGFMVGQLEQRLQQKSGEAATVRDLAKRTVRVYLYHCALLVFAFTLFAGIAVTYHRLALQNLLSFYVQDPRQAVIAAVLLEYRPSLLDILPLYIVFLALTPLARKIAQRWSWDPVVYSSVAVWMAAQFGLRGWLYRQGDLFGLSVPENSTGAFDLYAWQLLWLVGLALGSIYADRLANPSPAASDPSEAGIPGWLVKLSILIASTLLILRYSPTANWMDANVYGWLIDKWHLGPVRVVNFAALTIVLVRFGSRLARSRITMPLASLGQASIEVFSVHVLCCLGGDALSKEADPQLPWWQQTLLLVFTVATLFATAHVARKLSAHRQELKSLRAAKHANVP